MKKLVSLILFCLIAFQCTFAYAAAIREDSEYFQNVTSSFGNYLVDPNSSEKSTENFIIVYYSSGCYNSHKLMPTFAQYGKDNKIQVYAINYNDSRGFMASKFTGNTTLCFPIVLAYNAATGNISCKDMLQSEADFLNLVDNAFSQTASVSADPITIQIGSTEMMCGNKKIILDVPAAIINDRTMVPLRAIAEALGAEVDWAEKTQTITATRGTTTVILQIGESIMTVNGTAYGLDVPPQIINGRTLVPVRAISTGFGRSVGWHAATQTVDIQ